MNGGSYINDELTGIMARYMKPNHIRNLQGTAKFLHRNPFLKIEINKQKKLI